MAQLRPLTVLLSQALIAFTIELDNEWEQRVPTATTDFGGRGVWGTSLRQWSNFMQYVPGNGISVGELTRVARAKPQLNAMQRWGYVSVGADRVVRPKRGGLRAQAAWRELPGEIEGRWVQRLGRPVVAGLRGLLEPVASTLRAGMPDWITDFHGGYAVEPVKPVVVEQPLPLSAVLSLPLQALTLAYERESTASLSYTVNVLRPLDADGVAVASLPESTGVAIESLRTAIGILQKRGFLERRGRTARLTDLGAAAREDLSAISATVERKAEWSERARSLLEGLVTDDAPLWPRIDPPPGSWRSKAPRAQALPWHPIPRQGGHPDGV
jgi:hypothetical protein